MSGIAADAGGTGGETLRAMSQDFDLEGMSFETAAAPAHEEARSAERDRETPARRWWFGFDRWFSLEDEEEFVLA
jgi:hypothetical protein